MNQATATPAPALKLRTWCYAYPPRHYEISGCSCGNHDTTWSEFERHIWCQKCEKDFIPEHAGVFDGPIAIQTAAMLGLCFDRFNLQTQKLERFDLDQLAYVNEQGKLIEDLTAPAPAAEPT